jgi:hypothetical protein
MWPALSRRADRPPSCPLSEVLRSLSDAGAEGITFTSYPKKTQRTGRRSAATGAHLRTMRPFDGKEVTTGSCRQWEDGGGL